MYYFIQTSYPDQTPQGLLPGRSALHQECQGFYKFYLCDPIRP